MGRQSLLNLNDRLAGDNRRLFRDKGITVINVVSSPGAGKTALLEKTMRELGRDLKVAAIVGDLATNHDADRLRASGAPAHQITTGSACHLDAHMVHHALYHLDLEALDLLFIENVGNLVCPASFDLGEDLFVVLLATTEGEDKPLKYPVIFLKADAVIVNKTDLATAVDFDRTTALAHLAEAAPKARIFETSAKNGDGVALWCDYLRKLSVAKKRTFSPA
ncbi:MAG TPA: hydrogenase nickel incorporation protein HypB [Kiritimatiellia bacterium]|nr:hydrogenase nickel incorporation protein HypB [Kiritimatiellia bacterium]HMP00265.1 hydrogenase nickel incorporation protein HypB [Kiritimatiellia bacterium]HMP97507.1 hydrogenase nickel incorporation protein HypB [Kiritimatiellia bacterium]